MVEPLAICVGSSVRLLRDKTISVEVDGESVPLVVLAGSSGTVITIEEREGAQFVESGFSGKLVKSFIQELECIAPKPTTDTVAAAAEDTVKSTEKASRVRHTLGQMEVYESFRADYEFKNLNCVAGNVCTDIGKVFPLIFGKLRPQIALRFPERIEALKNKPPKKKDQRKKQSKEAVSMEEKEQEIKSMLAEKQNKGRRVLPSSLVVSIALLLYSISMSGAPMSSGLALPVILAHIAAEGYGAKGPHNSLVHSCQPSFPVQSMKLSGFVPEPGRMFWSQRTVNKFYRSIGLTMRQGTGNICKAVQPVELANLRKLMGLLKDAVDNGDTQRLAGFRVPNRRDWCVSVAFLGAWTGSSWCE